MLFLKLQIKVKIELMSNDATHEAAYAVLSSNANTLNLRQPSVTQCDVLHITQSGQRPEMRSLLGHAHVLIWVADFSITLYPLDCSK